MKKPVLIVACLLFMIVSCKQSPEEKAKALIKEELRTTLHDYKSYEPVNYGILDSSFSSPADLVEYREAKAAMSDNLEKLKEFNSDLEIYGRSWVASGEFANKKEQYKLLNIEFDKAKKTVDSILKGFVPRFSSWKMKHSYRAKSLVGNLGIHHYDYYFDSSLTKIIKNVDISK